MRNLTATVAFGIAAVALNVIDGNAQVLESDSLALVALHDSTDGANWTNAPTWLNGPVSDWEGVRVAGGRVTQLRLLGFNLTGVLPTAVADLDSLNLLWLSNNNVAGGFPEFIIGMPALTSIDFGLNQFGGPIPPELGQMTRLTRLNLSRNAFTGTIPQELANLINLDAFMVSDNGLSGEIPSGIWELPLLRHLQLYSNDFTGQIPESVGNLTSLESLLLNNTLLSGPIPESIGNLTQLGSLWIGGGAITGAIPASIGNLTEMFQLFIESTELTGPIPPEIGNLTELNTLRLTMNGLSGSIPPELGRLASLSLMWLGFNDLSGEIPEELGGLSAIESIRFRGNPQLTGPLPWSFTNLAELEFLDISGTDICIIDNPAFHTWLDSVQTVVPRPAQACAPGVASELEVPSHEFGIASVFPNPVRSSQTIAFSLPDGDHVKMVLYDGLGRRVKILADAHYAAGSHRVSWIADDLAPGTYWIDVRAGSSRRLQATVIAR